MSLSKSLPTHIHNNTLRDHVAPSTWKNPTAADLYQLVIIGGGSAGLVAASAAAQLGAKVALIEKDMLGGDCLNVGCVPSKAIIRAGKVMGELKQAADLGVHIPLTDVTVDFAKVMEHVWSARATIAPHDSAARFTNLGVDLFFGTAEFIGQSKIRLDDGQTLTFKKSLIATGSSPRHLPIEGLAETGYLTNETLWNITTQPQTLAVIGAGPIGCELAQAFQRLGTQVTLIDLSHQVLVREDADAAAIIQDKLISEGMTLCLSATTKSVWAHDGKKCLMVERHGATETICVDEILLAVGRVPNVNQLNLEAADVVYNKHGVTVDDYLQTTNPAIFAAGDVAMKHQFTHAAGHAAGIVVRNALMRLPKAKLSHLILPWATYTDPEIAHVGLYAKEAADEGIPIDTYDVHMTQNDRAITDNDVSGFVRIHTKKGKDTIVGATIVSKQASEMINEITIAMKHDIGLGSLANVIHPYPTQAEAIAKAATAYNKTRLTPVARKLIKLLMR